MLFTEFKYGFFLPLIFLLYWYVCRKSLKAQNILLLTASYFFYSCWDWRFLFLLVFSTALDYFSGQLIAKASSRSGKLAWLWTSILINLGFLGVFKYYNFFVLSFAELTGQFGFAFHPDTLSIILPVGISFYTFHGLSYVVDVYYGRIRPENNFVDYSLFVSYFPLLVAGPIERATHLLPQVKKERNFSYPLAVSGLRQILWGLFKKVVIADQCGQVVNNVFTHYGEYNGITLFMGAVMFSFQIYGDFSGYSDIALGSSRLFGIELLRNFNYPYFSRDIAEFWRRWHISLSSWFRDYVYIPLGGSVGGVKMRIRNTFIIFLLSGFWHGANWTFLAWGFLNALFIMPSMVMGSNRKNIEIVAGNRLLPSPGEFLSMLLTFIAATFCWIFFRAPSVGFAIDYIGRIFTAGFFCRLNFQPYILMAEILIFVLIEWAGRRDSFPILSLEKWLPLRWLRYAFYYLLCIVVYHYSGSSAEFIYFQF